MEALRPTGFYIPASVTNNRLELLLMRNRLHATRGRTRPCQIVPVDGPLDSPASPLQLSVSATS